MALQGDQYRADSDTNDGEIEAVVRVRDVQWLKKALVASMLTLANQDNWTIPPGVSNELVSDYANEILDSLTFDPPPPEPTSFTIGAVTTAAAQTVRIEGLRSNAGAFSILWGDGSKTDYPSGYTGSPTKQYVQAGVYQITITAPPDSITWLVLLDPKVIVNVGTVRALTTLSVMQFDGTPLVYVARDEINELTNLAFIYVRNSSGVGRFTGLANLPKLSTLRINNNYTSNQVDDVLSQLWNQAALKTSNGGSIHVGGSNSAPNGVFQNRCPPTTGQEYRFQLLYDTCGQFVDPSRRWAEVTVST